MQKDYTTFVNELTEFQNYSPHLQRQKKNETLAYKFHSLQNFIDEIYFERFGVE